MDLSIILSDWPYDDHEEAKNVRKVVGLDGAAKLQVRIRNGLLQWEVHGRPDGRRPHGCHTVLDYCRQMLREGPGYGSRGQATCSLLNAELVEELAEELFDFYRRGRSLSLIGDYAGALGDMVHSLQILRLMRESYADQAAIFGYDRHRPSLLMERSRCAMLLRLHGEDVRGALDALNSGIEEIEEFHAEYGMEERAGESTERQILVDLRRSLREKHCVPLNDDELLSSLMAEQEVAIRRENYEMAARLRDKIHSLQQRMTGEQ
jgi:hypothetical protein